MTPIAVRDARATDADALAELCTQLGYPSAAADMPARLARFTAAEHSRAFVATADDVVAGLAGVQIRYALNHAQPLAQLVILVVDANHRSLGIGRVLVDAAEAWARECGGKRLIVTTALDRTDAHAFYEAVGFHHTGRRYGKDLA